MKSKLQAAFCMVALALTVAASTFTSASPQSQAWSSCAQCAGADCCSGAQSCCSDCQSCCGGADCC